MKEKHRWKHFPKATHDLRNKEYMIKDFHQPQKNEDHHLVMYVIQRRHCKTWCVCVIECIEILN
jgi:hypothetical protein